MSMLSRQADELRKAALIQGAHACYDVANLLTDAADTIISLRDRAQELQAENTKLRELMRHLRECTRHNVCAACKYADDVCDFDYDMRELGVELG